LSNAFATAQTSMEFDAYARTYAGHRTMTVGDRSVRLVPLRVGTRPIGLLAAAGRTVEAGTLDTLAGVVAIAIERAQFLEERRAAAQTRQSDELKSALLASLSHDLRTPLTSIRVAATNAKASALDEDHRREQIDLILADVERLTRLFENILEMARLDAGAVVTEARWAPPSEIIAAARDQVAHTLQRHRVDVDIDEDLPLRIDGRITASAVAHLLENAAQYTPDHATIDVVSRMTKDGLMIKVRDRGPGIAPADLPHVFDRFFRGASARGRASGTGMGLWIARGLLAVEHGRIWVDNCPAGGAEFTLIVPAVTKASEWTPVTP
jgi:two-component system sensor histidine kinase KdpD